MNRSETISKSKQVDLSRDYQRLRELGLDHIEALSSKIWTDYNVHDPGITILELLCYAITDLGYRTSYKVEDLLADRSAPSPPRDRQFYTAREILTCNPVTISDYRKLLIDVEGVKNAWLKPAKNSSIPLYIDCKNSRLVKEPAGGDELEKLVLRGLYSVTLELDEDPKYGDLNQYLFEISLFDPAESDKSKASMRIGLPDWSRWIKAGVTPEKISWVKLTNITNIDNVNFDITVRLKSGDDTIELPGWIKTEKPINETDMLADRLAAEGIKEKYANKIRQALSIAGEAGKRLHRNRNLCEDYEEFHGIDIEEVGICADIAVESDAEIEKVLAQLFYEIKNHLSPDVRFYTLEEMLDRDVPVEEIFNGPPLDHGFIDDRELKQSEIIELCKDNSYKDYKYGKIYVSDLIQIIMDLEGVKAVKNIILASAYQGEVINDKIEWSLEIGAGRFPRLRLERSDIVFYKENIPYTPDESKVENYIRELELSERKAKRSREGFYDLPVPTGSNRQVADYTSIQEHLPTTYGVGSGGIPGQITDTRRGQAKQLKAYLTFFDQLLANYLAQLANVKNLFSFSSKVRRTYFYQILYSVPEEFDFTEFGPGRDAMFAESESPHYYSVVKDFIDRISDSDSVDLDDYSTFREEWVKYKKDKLDGGSPTHIVKGIDKIVEDRETFEERRNRFLDHLLARFGESFSDYVLLMYSIANDDGHGENRDPDEMIHDKEEFLKGYPALSAERGKAFNYKAEDEIWDTGNVSGYTKRLSKLLGIEHYNRRNLLCKPVDELFETFKSEETGEWRFRLRNQEGVIVLRSEGYTTKNNRDNGIESVKSHGTDIEYYERHRSKDNRYYFNLVASNGEIIGTSRLYEHRHEREEAIQEMISDLRGECNREGFFLVEHILLRPERIDDDTLPICVSKNCKDCPGFRDPYSFRISLIIPYWPDRFDNMAFRRFFEQTARREAPAHVHLKICWADKPDIEKFEDVYKKWLQTKAEGPSEESTKALNNLISTMRKIRSVYPVATLHDCDEDEGENPLLLDNTALGTIKPE